MKLVMINDCASVGENLLKYMPSTVEKQHIVRTRGLWSKTFGVAYKILKAEADVYHSNYLLQDCYITIRLGKKPTVGYALGSDLRKSLRHWLLGRVVRHNLKKCDKIIVSTPDILNIAQQFRSDAEYLPPPVDMELFHPKPSNENVGKKKVLIASNSSWKVKGTDIAIRAVSRLKNEFDVSIIQHGEDFDRTLSLASSLGLDLKILPKAPHNKIRQYYWDSDVVVDQFKFGCAGMITLEAIASGRPAVSYVTSEHREYRDFPLKDLTSEEQIAEAIADADAALWKKEYDYLLRNHEPYKASQRLLTIYESLMQNQPK